MDDQVKRALRVGGEGVLDMWRREAERRGEDWRTEVLKTFAKDLPDLNERLVDEVWPGQLEKAFREHFRFGEDVEITTVIQDNTQGWRCCEIWTDDCRWNPFRMVLQETDIIAENWDWDQIYDSVLAFLYLRMAIKENDPLEYRKYRVDVDAEVIERDANKGLWVLSRVYIYDGAKGATMRLDMPLEYRRDARRAVAWLIENALSKGI